MAAIVTAHVKQNAWRAGRTWMINYPNIMYNSTFDLKKFLTVMQPMANAQMSVIDVTVIATPACLIVFPILSPMSSSVLPFLS